MKLTNEEIAANHEEIIALLRSTNREGIDNVINYLESTPFFEAPSSISRHHNWRGGLAEHSLGVYREASKLNNGIVAVDSLVIASLLHDVCKASLLSYNERGHIIKHKQHIKGHGRRSLKLLQLLNLSMTPSEQLAIRWHMGGHNALPCYQPEVQLAREDPLWQLVHQADKADARAHPACHDMKANNDNT
ncbi:MAG: HD domain-containing protein [Muribaculaceae bacterium]